MARSKAPEVAEPTVRECRYSASHGGWFWTVTAPNPLPLPMPDGTPNGLDAELYESAFSSSWRSAQKDIKRTKRKMVKKIERAHREIARAAKGGSAGDV